MDNCLFFCKNTTFLSVFHFKYDQIFTYNLFENLFISHPFYHLLDRRFFTVHQNTYPVDFGS